MLGAALWIAAPPAPRAAVEERPPVTIELIACDDAIASEAQRIAAIELRATLAQSADDRRTIQVIATCDGDAVRLEAQRAKTGTTPGTTPGTTTGKTVERTVILSDAAPSARARLLALAVAELVAASWSDREAEQEEPESAERHGAPAPTRVSELGPTRDEPLAASPHRTYEVAPMAGVHVLSSRDWLYGAGARVVVWLSPRAFLRLDALADYGELGRTMGTVTVLMPSGVVAIGASLWSQAWLRPSVSVGIRASYVWMAGRGESADIMGSRQRGFCLGPEVGLQLDARAHSRIRPFVALVAGANMIGLRGTVETGASQPSLVGGTAVSPERDVQAVGVWGGMKVGVAVP